MNLAIIGANGGVGRCLVRQALEAGHQVTAAMRNPSTFPLSHERLRPLACDVLDGISVGRAVAGQDAVYCALGESHRKATRLYSEGARNIVRAMRNHEVRRIVFLSNFGMLDETADDWKGRLMLLLVRHVIGSTLTDHRRAFETIRARIPEWVVVRPLALTNGPFTGRYRTVTEGLPPGGIRIARADVADFMLRQATTDDHLNCAPAIAY
jgi:putative NADH-flavin reductase